VRQVEAQVEFYLSALNFDPAAPLFPVSAPASYAGELADRIGLFSTLGMAEDHNGLNNGRLNEAAYLAQCELVLAERERLMRIELERFTEGFFFLLYDTPDRVQHMLWRFREPDHPANKGQAPSPAFRRAIEEHYRRGDEVVGQVLPYVDDRTLLIVLSDHGFGSFRRQFHVNKWLYDHGLLALKAGHEPGEAGGDMLRGVDWEKTRAYGLGLSGLYLNLQGREARGTVRPEEAEELKTAISRGLSGLEDPERQATAIRSVLPREQVYSGPFVPEAPDLIINYSPGYRVSWSSSLGGVSDGGIFEDNTKKWAGDHIIDPALVPGVLLMNRPFRGERARLLDLAPTILTALGVSTTHAWEGASLLP
jgi:predicted AlkP superfamily phosphohydrolase/phosphomutase